MTTTITLPEPLATQLKQHAITHNRSVETLAIEYLVAALTEAEPPVVVPPELADRFAQHVDALVISPQGDRQSRAALFAADVDDQSGDLAEVESWLSVLRAIDAVRTSSRPLFDTIDAA